jgi:hypothetical protein
MRCALSAELGLGLSLGLLVLGTKRTVNGVWSRGMGSQIWLHVIVMWRDVELPTFLKCQKALFYKVKRRMLLQSQVLVRHAKAPKLSR